MNARQLRAKERGARRRAEIRARGVWLRANRSGDLLAVRAMHWFEFALCRWWFLVALNLGASLETVGPFRGPK